MPRCAIRTALRGGPGQAALRFQYLQHAGGWYAFPVLAVRRLRGVRVSTVRHSDGSRKVTWVRVRARVRIGAAGR